MKFRKQITKHTAVDETFYLVSDAAGRLMAKAYSPDVAILVSAAPELLAALRRCVPWIGKMIADGAHKNSVLPLDCENALRQAEAAIAKATT
jgi:hypothetical protein